MWSDLLTRPTDRQSTQDERRSHESLELLTEELWSLPSLLCLVDGSEVLTLLRLTMMSLTTNKHRDVHWSWQVLRRWVCPLWSMPFLDSERWTQAQMASRTMGLMMPFESDESYWPCPLPFWCFWMQWCLHLTIPFCCHWSRRFPWNGHVKACIEGPLHFEEPMSLSNEVGLRSLPRRTG